MPGRRRTVELERGAEVRAEIADACYCLATEVDGRSDPEFNRLDIAPQLT
jgi:hypothetical protein